MMKLPWEVAQANVSLDLWGSRPSRGSGASLACGQAIKQINEAW